MVKKEKIEQLRNDLTELLELMEENNIEEIKTVSNTYFCSNHFISFGSDGFMDFTDVFGLIRDEDEEEW